MERRVFLAIFLAFIVMYVFNTYIAPPPPVPEQAPATASSTAGAASGGATATTPAVTTPSAGASSPSSAAPAAAAAPAALTGEPAEREIVVDTTTIQAVFSNRGARLLHWRLKDYRDDVGKPLDLVPTGVPADQPSPFALRVDDEAITRRLRDATYRVSTGPDGHVDARSAPASLVFEFVDAAGLRVRKEFGFQPDNYVVSFAATVQSGDRSLPPTILWGPGLGDIGVTRSGGSFFTGNYVQAPQAIYHLGGKVERLAATKMSASPVHEGEFRFGGIDDHYFIVTAVNPGRARFEFGSVTLPGAAENTQRQLVTQSIRMPAAQSPATVRMYVGPKQFDLLKSVDGELVRAINFGMFAWLVVPLLGALKWLHAFFGNWGISIIVLTILIQLAMFPLRHKQMVSMRKMQAIQPQIKAIQDRYADLKISDPARQKMNTEVMNLYREKGVNPAGGCVPMLLTFPVLLAFYSLLQQSIELRGADFGLWIHDLSQHDPYYVTPLIMGATMFWQQRMMPATVDPAQQRMMMFMPVVFTAMFLQLPSGLAIYYLASNLLQIGQQWMTNRLIGAAPQTQAQPAATRRLKNAGAGRTAAAERKD